VLVDQFGVCSIMPAGAVAKPAWVGLSEWQVAQRWVMMAWMRVKSGVVAAAAVLPCAEAPAGTAAAAGSRCHRTRCDGHGHRQQHHAGEDSATDTGPCDAG
jgi:hypothetical protein